MTMFNIFKRRKAQQTIRELNERIESVQDTIIEETRDAIIAHDLWVMDHLTRARKHFTTFKHGDFSNEYFAAQRDMNRWNRMIEVIK